MIPICVLFVVIYILIEKNRKHNEKQPIFVWCKYVEKHEVTIDEVKSDDGMHAPPDIQVIKALERPKKNLCINKFC